MVANALRQHTYGSGEISFARYLANTETPGAYRYLGNTPEFTVSSEQETLPHMDVDHGIRYQDDEIVTSQSLGGTVVTDNINQENVALYFTGTSGIITDSSATAAIENIAEIQIGTYHLGVTTIKPTGVRHISNVVVTNGVTGLGAVTYVAGTDYVVDGISGTVTFLEGGTIEAGDPAKITYDIAANSREQVVSGNDSIVGALKFKSFNPAGPRRDYFMPKVRLSPQGEFALKGDDWLTIPFDVAILRKGDLEAVYADGVAVTS